MNQIYGICGLLGLLLVSACTAVDTVVVETREPEVTAVNRLAD